MVHNDERKACVQELRAIAKQCAVASCHDTAGRQKVTAMIDAIRASGRSPRRTDALAAKYRATFADAPLGETVADATLSETTCSDGEIERSGKEFSKRAQKGV